MLDVMDYDELNKLVGMNRSEDYEDYFGIMDLSDSDKEKRIELAERLEDNFLLVLAFLFTMQQYQSINWQTIRTRFESAYRDALEGVIILDEYLDSYIRQFSYDVTKSTQNHANDPYYYSMDRSRLMAENEANTAWNYSDFQSAIQNGYTRKQWIDIRDKKERETHRKVGRTVIPIEELFSVGSTFMRFPKDQAFSPPASETANCRCSIRYF